MESSDDELPLALIKEKLAADGAPCSSVGVTDDGSDADPTYDPHLAANDTSSSFSDDVIDDDSDADPDYDITAELRKMIQSKRKRCLHDLTTNDRIVQRPETDQPQSVTPPTPYRTAGASNETNSDQAVIENITPSLTDKTNLAASTKKRKRRSVQERDADTKAKAAKRETKHGLRPSNCSLKKCSNRKSNVHLNEI